MPSWINPLSITRSGWAAKLAAASSPAAAEIHRPGLPRPGGGKLCLNSRIARLWCAARFSQASPEIQETMNTLPESLRAFRLRSSDGRLLAAIETMPLAELSAGEVVIRVQYSDINYKDALAATALGRISRRYPLNGGIDLAGVVAASSDARYRVGDAVLVTGCGLSETRDGGYAEYARVPAEAVVAMPAGFDARSAMAVGTAGYAAALAIVRLEQNGQEPGQGPIVVNGATGGVGSLAIDMLTQRGYEVIAVSNKAAAHDYLRELGAKQVWSRAEFGSGNEPLLSVRWAGAIDNLGGEALARLLAGTRNNGSVASVGLAQSGELHTTVMPFILRGVNLLGVNSSSSVRSVRELVWQRIASDLRPAHLERIVQREISFDELPGAFAPFLAGTVQGRVRVRIA